jgi:hypothetical protein
MKNLIFLPIFSCLLLASCGGGNDLAKAVGVKVLDTSQSVIIKKDETIIVPEETTVQAPNGGAITKILGSGKDFEVPAGSLLTAPAVLRRKADNIVTGV